MKNNKVTGKNSVVYLIGCIQNGTEVLVGMYNPNNRQLIWPLLAPLFNVNRNPVYSGRNISNQLH